MIRATRPGRPTRTSQFLGHDPGLRVQLALSNRPVQYPLSVRPRPRRRVSEGNRQQSSEAASHPVLVHEPHAGRGYLGRGSRKLLAERRPSAGRRKGSLGRGGHEGHGPVLDLLTFQITHATDSDTNVERDDIIDELKNIGSIEAVKVYQAGQRL